MTALLACLLSVGCASVESPESDPPPAIDLSVYQRAERERRAQLEKEVESLRTDLRRAEEALIAVESGLRGTHSRADAVSSLAESRILVERAAAAAPWRVDEIQEARQKLEEANRQLDQGNSGAALFFAYRAQRIAELVQLEAQAFRKRTETSFVTAESVNLRSGPSTSEPVIAVLLEGTPLFVEQNAGSWALVRTTLGSVGWIHERLLGAP